jgi:quercetin dioxygenase-like cupin family protein
MALLRREDTVFRKTVAFATAASVALCLFASGAMAQTKKAAVKPGTSAEATPKVFGFPEVPAAPRPPGAPTMEEALAAYLSSDRSYGGTAAQTPAAPGTTPPAPPGPGRTLPPILSIGPVPDPSHIMFKLPEDIPWKGTAGTNQTWNIFGSPTEPGPYMQLMKWWPGAYSNPHMHPNTRNMLVVSGTWWVCSCTTQDKTKTYPMTAGSFVTEPGYTYHWDGARNEPAVILIWGNGPSPNIAVNEQGLPDLTKNRRASTATTAPAAAPRP